jgi:hypothetical protein
MVNRSLHIIEALYLRTGCRIVSVDAVATGKFFLNIVNAEARVTMFCAMSAADLGRSRIPNRHCPMAVPETWGNELSCSAGPQSCRWLQDVSASQQQAMIAHG